MVVAAWKGMTEPAMGLGRRVRMVYLEALVAWLLQMLCL